MLRRLVQVPRQVLLLALPVPVMVLALAAWLGTARGPYYLGANADPDYAYLLNALGLLQGHSPNHTDHPGTPVQAAGAVVIAATYAVSGSGGLVKHVLTHPERYLGVLNAVFVAACALAFLAAGIAAYLHTRSLLLMLLMQVTPLLALQDTLALTVVRPEPWLLCLSLALGSVLVGIATDPARMDSASTGKWLGVITGLGVAAKVTFIPLVLLPLVVLRGRRPRVAFGLWSALTLFICLIPILPRARQVARWFIYLTIRKGAYGSGELGLVETATILPGLKLLALSEPVFLAVLAASCLVLFALWMKWRAGAMSALQGTGLRVLLAFCLAGLAQLLFATKRPVPHYMLPAMALMGAQTVTVCWLLAQARRPGSSDAARSLPAAVVAPVSVLVLCAAVFAGWSTWRQRERLVQQRDALLTLALQAEAEAGQGRTVFFYRCSSPVYALNFGNEFCGRFFAGALAEAHPKALFYDAWKASFNDFRGPVPREDVAKLPSAAPLRFWGSAWETYPPNVRPAELIFQAKAAAAGEVLYQAQPVP